MYLTNNELQKIHTNIVVDCDNPKYPFQPKEQIRVCSIDIRVDRVFWRMKRLGFPVQLSRNKLLEISPRDAAEKSKFALKPAFARYELWAQIGIKRGFRPDL